MLCPLRNSVMWLGVIAGSVCNDKNEDSSLDKECATHIKSCPHNLELTRDRNRDSYALAIWSYNMRLKCICTTCFQIVAYCDTTIEAVISYR